MRAAGFDAPVTIHNDTAQMAAWGESTSVLLGLCPLNAAHSLGPQIKQSTPAQPTPSRIQTKEHEEALQKAGPDKASGLDHIFLKNPSGRCGVSLQVPCVAYLNVAFYVESFPQPTEGDLCHTGARMTVMPTPLTVHQTTNHLPVCSSGQKFPPLC